jgi:dTDP-4-dehydrorhamnose 3,5-epimerase
MGNDMDIQSLGIPEVKLIAPKVFGDDRGFFQQLHHSDQYRAAGIDCPFVQDNWSRSCRGTLRGLHYQLAHGQDKLVFVIRGEVFDVAVDIRRGSPTFGQWAGSILSEDNHRQLFIPKGFAHGFCVLSESADFMYKCSDLFAPGDEYGIRWDDPDIGIEWPDIAGEAILSAKDAQAPYLKEMPRDQLPALYAETGSSLNC